VERPFLLQDFPRFLRLDPVHDVPDVGKGGGEGGVKEGSVYGDNAK